MSCPTFMPWRPPIGHAPFYVSTVYVGRTVGHFFLEPSVLTDFARLSTVSACHGAGTDPLSPNCYPSKFFYWWNTVFPHPASELTNGAMRRTNSDYYSFCSSHHIPDVTDLIIIELDTDDNEWVSLFSFSPSLTPSTQR